VLRALGEYASAERPSAEKNIKPLTRQIETALDILAPEFPELETLLGSRTGRGGNGSGTNTEKDKKLEERNAPPVGIDGITAGLRGEKEKKKRKQAKDGSGAARKKPGLSLALEDLTDAPGILGRMVEDTLSINTLHPAWKKALATKQEEYHILVIVGLVLAEFVAPEKNAADFLAKFLSSWSAVGAEEETGGQTRLL
jgi:hypothetical protein